jgi:hypothetical protein
MAVARNFYVYEVNVTRDNICRAHLGLGNIIIMFLYIYIYIYIYVPVLN